jgi:hypothetical protein
VFEPRNVDQTRAIDAVVIAAMIKVGGDLLPEVVKISIAGRERTIPLNPDSIAKTYRLDSNERLNSDVLAVGEL